MKTAEKNSEKKRPDEQKWVFGPLKVKILKKNNKIKIQNHTILHRLQSFFLILILVVAMYSLSSVQKVSEELKPYLKSCRNH